MLAPVRKSGGFVALFCYFVTSNFAVSVGDAVRVVGGVGEGRKNIYFAECGWDNGMARM